MAAALPPGRSVPRVLRHRHPDDRADARRVPRASSGTLASWPAAYRRCAPRVVGVVGFVGLAGLAALCVLATERGRLPLPGRVPAGGPGHAGRDRRRRPPGGALRPPARDPLAGLHRSAVVQHLPLALAGLRARPARGRTSAPDPVRGLRAPRGDHPGPGRPVVPPDRGARSAAAPSGAGPRAGGRAAARTAPARPAGCSWSAWSARARSSS